MNLKERIAELKPILTSADAAKIDELIRKNGIRGLPVSLFNIITQLQEIIETYEFGVKRALHEIIGQEPNLDNMIVKNILSTTQKDVEKMGE